MQRQNDAVSRRENNIVLCQLLFNTQDDGKVYQFTTIDDIGVEKLSREMTGIKTIPNPTPSFTTDGLPGLSFLEGLCKSESD